jgi:hypothetical protein
MDVHSVYNFLTVEQWFQAVSKTYGAAGWRFGGNSVDDQGFKFWHLDLINDEFFTKTMFEKICQDTDQDWDLHRVYANGQTYGLCGDLHEDVTNVEPGKYYTLLYYANPKWENNWGGYTVFIDPATGGTFSRYPTPNSMAFFDSTITHAGLEPTRHCTDIRVTVAFKLSKK